MSGSETYIEQALQWFGENSREYDTELCLDLPGFGWITVISISTVDGDVTCEFISGFMSRKSPDTLIFPANKITAIRRSKRLTGFLSDED